MSDEVATELRALRAELSELREIVAGKIKPSCAFIQTDEMALILGESKQRCQQRVHAGFYGKGRKTKDRQRHKVTRHAFFEKHGIPDPTRLEASR